MKLFLVKQFTRWLAIPTTLALTLGVAGAALSETIAITPSSNAVQVGGTSGGSAKGGSCAGNIAANPNHVIRVTQDANLRFTLQANGGQPTLLIRGSTGQDFCVAADSYSGGKIDIPGRWTEGTYSVFVGDRANGQHAYTLSISRS